MFQTISRVPFIYKLVLLIVGVAVTFGVFASPAKAQSTADLQRMIEQLMQQIAQLKAQAELDGIREQVDSCPSLTRDLKLGDTDSTTGGEVSTLQAFLVKRYGLNRADYVTGYFGTGTRGLVQRFQGEYKISAVGTVGPQTRTAIAGSCVAGGTVSITNLTKSYQARTEEGGQFSFSFDVTATDKSVTIDASAVKSEINNDNAAIVVGDVNGQKAELDSFSADLLLSGVPVSGSITLPKGITRRITIQGTFSVEETGQYYVDLRALRFVHYFQTLNLKLVPNVAPINFKTDLITIKSKENVSVPATGIDVDVVDSDANALVFDNGNSTGQFTIEFEVAADDEDYYIKKLAGVNNNGGVKFVIEDSSGGQAVGTTTAVLSSNADEEYLGTYVVEEGTSEDFTLTISFEPAVTGSYRARMISLQYGVTPWSATTTINLIPASWYRTSYISLIKNFGGATTDCGKLLPGKTLTPGQFLTSCDKSHTLRFQTDGNLVLYKGSTALWASNTVGKGSTRFSMQTDGNIVIYAGSKAIWSLLSYQGGRMGTGQYLQLKDDGTLAVYNQKGEVRWSTSMPLKPSTPTGTSTTPLPKPTTPATTTPPTPTGTLSVTPCVIGSAPSKLSTRTDVCDSTITWNTQNATKAYTSITGSSPYLKSIYPYGYTTPGGNKLSGTNVPFWTPAGTYTVSLYVNGDYSNSKTVPNTGTKVAEQVVTVAPAVVAPATPTTTPSTATNTSSTMTTVNQMANVLEALRSILQNWR